jgi:phosphoribosylformylglycinamidine (FGAM) synthase-like enzyme
MHLKLILQTEKDLQALLLSSIQKGLIKSAHDISEGGILTALAECCIINEKNPIGAEVNIPVKSREDFSFFSESQSRVIVSIDESDKEKFEKAAAESFTPFNFLGKTGGDSLKVNNKYGFGLNSLISLYYNSIPERMNA